MNKTTKIVIAVVAVVVVAVALVLLLNSKSASKLSVNSAEDLTALVDKIYEGVSIEMPMLMTQAIETNDPDMVSYVTGLEDAKDVEYVVASEPMMTSQAYSLVLVKVKDGVDANSVAKTMNENINERKWICVTAEKIYTAASGDVVCLVMSNADTAKAVYDSFKTLAGSVGQEYERAAEEIELPDDMLPGQDGLIDQPAAM